MRRDRAPAALRRTITPAMQTLLAQSTEDAMGGKKRIAIACQGGGSQCAFVAGALSSMFARDVQQRYRIVGLSGTSGGALTAAVAWFGLLQQAAGDATPIEQRVLRLWRDLTAQTALEIAFDAAMLRISRLQDRGALPQYALSPSSPAFRLAQRITAAAIGRPAFTDLRALLAAHIDFDALPALIRPDSPVLLAGAADVLEGTFKIFNSTRGEISLDALLASAAIPTLFPAVWVNGHAYWDGIFSSNPPVVAFLRRLEVLELPEEIWIVHVNRARDATLPEAPNEINDRRNQLAGNLSLSHELELVSIVNFLLDDRALTEDFRRRYGFSASEKISVRSIRMSTALESTLDHSSKLSRQPAHIEALIRDGAAQANAFLDSLEGEARAVVRSGESTWNA
jgi:NTE family protein